MKIIKTRMFKYLVLIFLFGVALGIVSYYFISDFEKESLFNVLNNYFYDIKNNKVSYFNGLISSILSNLKYILIIWVLGLLSLLIVLIPFLVLYKGILLGLSLISILYCFKVKGILYSLILFFPCKLINIIIFLFISYYSIHFGIKNYNTIKNNKNINLKQYIKNYFYIFIILSIFLIINNILEIYFISKILKFVV